MTGNVTAIYDQALAECRPELGRLRLALNLHIANRGEPQGMADFVAFLRARSPSELSMLLLVALRDGAS